MDSYEFCVNTMKFEKNYRKDFDNRIKQLCEDFCDQSDERKLSLYRILDMSLCYIMHKYGIECT